MAGPKGTMPENLRKERDEKKKQSTKPKKAKLIRKPNSEDKNYEEKYGYSPEGVRQYKRDQAYSADRNKVMNSGMDPYQESTPQLGIVNYSSAGKNNFWKKQNANVLKGFTQNQLLQFDTNKDSSISLDEVKAMQKKLGLVADGKLGSASIKRLKSYLQGNAYNKLKNFENPLAKQRRLAKEKKEKEDAKRVISDTQTDVNRIDVEDAVLSNFTRNNFYSDDSASNKFKQNHVAPIYTAYSAPDSTIFVADIVPPARQDSVQQTLNDSTVVTLRSTSDGLPYYSFYNPKNSTDSTVLAQEYPYKASDLIIPVMTPQQQLDYFKRHRRAELNLGKTLGLRNTYPGFKPDTTIVDTTRQDTTRQDTAKTK